MVGRVAKETLPFFVGCWLLFVDCWWLVVGGWLLVVGCTPAPLGLVWRTPAPWELRKTTKESLPNNKQQTTNNKQRTTCIIPTQQQPTNNQQRAS